MSTGFDRMRSAIGMLPDWTAPARPDSNIVGGLDWSRTASSATTISLVNPPPK
jgi:hypothetical protein